MIKALHKPFAAFGRALQDCNDVALSHLICANAHNVAHTRLLKSCRFSEAAYHFNEAFTETAAARRANDWDNVVVAWWQILTNTNRGEA